ncbi:AAA family ATPase [Cellvibrio sp.]
MRLNKLTINNFRCFDHLTIDFHPQMTILIAPNGSGKTTILDAARIALWPYIKGFDVRGNSATIVPSDVRLKMLGAGSMEYQLPAQIIASGHVYGEVEEVTWSQTRERTKPGTNCKPDKKTKELIEKGKHFQKQNIANSEIVLPLITYLGTSRLWYEGRFTSAAEDVALNVADYSRTSGYLNCLSYSSSFKTFCAWYGWIYRSFREEQIKALENKTQLSETGMRFEVIISVVKAAVDTLIQSATGWNRLEYSASNNQQLVMHHEERGVLPVEMLSDGLRNAIAMVADIAFRTVKLNPQLGLNAATQTPGVALIDEVDMFLHLSWQQTIINSLQTAFPNIQFIVTTHSPQVLSTVKRENIRVIGSDIAEPPLAKTYGEPSGEVMHSVMSVDPQPPVKEKADLLRLTEWVDQGHYAEPESQALMKQLVAVLGEQHPQLQRLQRSIARQEALKP